jgi:hypothetical protein
LTQNLNKINFDKIDNKIFYFFITLISFSFTFYYGNLGVFPLDSFIIFDAGYKVLNGIHPFKDYWTISGPLLDYLQAIFFFFLETNWFSYVLHAAFINSLLAIIVYYFYVIIGLKKIYAFLYTTSISILAYPSVGTPFMDHHAVIFSLISIIFLILSFLKNDKKYWFLSGVFIIFSFFSKQIPSAYIGLIFIFIILFYFFLSKKNVRKNINYFIIGIISTSIFFLILFLANRIPLYNFFIQYILYPMTIGSDRITSFNFDLNNVFFQFKFIYLSLLPLALVFFIIIKKKLKNESNRKDFLVLSLLFLTFIVFIYSQLLTKNQIFIFFLIPFYLGISHFYSSKYYKKTFVGVFIFFILLITTTKYHLTYNENKKFMDFVNADFKIALNAEIIDERLRGLKWITPKYSNNPKHEIELINQSVEIILSDKKNKILVSNYQILSAVIKLKNYAPNKWFDPRSVPSKNNKYFVVYKEFFINNLKKQKIEKIYIIGKNKIKHLNFINKDNCMSYNQINEILFLASIEECLN